MDVSEIDSPALLIDMKKLERNIETMASKARTFSVSLRPHVKTHKCIEIARMQEEYGCRGITVSTLGEAEVFARAGFSDMTYAVPLEPSKIPRLLSLLDKVSVTAIVDNPQIVPQLDVAVRKTGLEIDVLIKVDMGYHRCGVDPSSNGAVSLVEKVVLSPSLNFRGILTHAGNSYSCQTKECIQDIAKQEQEKMVSFASLLSRQSTELTPEIVSIGSTPTITLCEDIISGITEVRPGNYAYFDYTQVLLGSCQVADCALTVHSRITGTYQGRAIIDAGATSLSRDNGPIHIEPDCGYGKLFSDYEESQLDTHCKLESLSQEHGKVTFESGSHLSSLSVGDPVRILPNHSCLTNNLFRKAYVVSDDNVIGIWDIHSGHT